MFQYRAVLVRLRQGDSDRDIARARLMGRPKVAALRALAVREGWLTVDTPLPEDAVIAAAIGRARRACSTISSVEPYRDIVERWAERGINGVVIDAAHQCMTTRGVHKPGMSMVTSRMTGLFRTDARTRREFLSIIGSPATTSVGNV